MITWSGFHCSLMLWCISRKILGVGQNFLENLEGWPKKFQKNSIFCPKFFFWGGQTLGFFHLVGGSRLSIPTLPAYTPPPCMPPCRWETNSKITKCQMSSNYHNQTWPCQTYIGEWGQQKFWGLRGWHHFYGNGIFNKIKFSNFFISERG